MRGFVFGEEGGCGCGTGGGECVVGRLGALVGEEGDDVGVDLGDDEMVDVEHLCESCHGEVVVHGSIDAALRRGIPRVHLPRL